MDGEGASEIILNPWLVCFPDEKADNSPTLLTQIRIHGSCAAKDTQRFVIQAYIAYLRRLSHADARDDIATPAFGTNSLLP
jgi:hypothetical protein